MTKVCIIGAGISGLLAALAADEAGAEVTLFDQLPGKATHVGLHYLHDPCGLDLEPVVVYNIVLTNDSDKSEPYLQYAKKLNIPGDNSLKDLPLRVDGWNLQQAYNLLWERFKDRCEEHTVEPKQLKSLVKEYNLVVSTIPLQRLIPGVSCFGREFKAYLGRPPGMSRALYGNTNNVVVYNTDMDYDWYRYSCINGLEWTEGLVKGDHSIIKPIEPEFKNPYPNLLLTGRWGKWKRGVLAHESYYEVKQRL